jgi:hypothetical protein
MAQGSDELGFAWANYPAHRFLIALRYKQAKRLTRCSLCQRRPIVRQTVLVHQMLRNIETPAMDPKRLIKALALCRGHDALTDDELADAVWGTSWREEWG